MGLILIIVRCSEFSSAAGWAHCGALICWETLSLPAVCPAAEWIGINSPYVSLGARSPVRHVVVALRLCQDGCCHRRLISIMVIVIDMFITVFLFGLFFVVVAMLVASMLASQVVE